MKKFKALWAKFLVWGKSAAAKTLVWTKATWKKASASLKWSALAVLAAFVLGWWAGGSREPEVVVQTRTVTAECVPVVVQAPAVKAPKAKSYRSPVSQVQSDDAVLPEPPEVVWQPPLTPVTRGSVDQYRASLRKE